LIVRLFGRRLGRPWSTSQGPKPVAAYLAGLASPESREGGFVPACLVRSFSTTNDDAQVVPESRATSSSSSAAATQTG